MNLYVTMLSRSINKIFDNHNYLLDKSFFASVDNSPRKKSNLTHPELMFINMDSGFDVIE